MKILFLAILCLLALNTSASTNGTIKAAAASGSELLLSPNTNFAVTEILSPLIMTNVSLFGYNSVYSNGTLNTYDVVPGFQPFGGNFFGLSISNSLEISQTNQQACLGFSLLQEMESSTFNFYDLVCVSAGSNGDAVSWKTDYAATNIVNFYNSQFRAKHWAFNLVGRGIFKFYGCLFDATGPSSDDSAVAFMPDQGPVTNFLYGCHLVARNGGSATWTMLEQIRSYNFLEGCTLEAVETNNANPSVTAFTCSGEGNYVTIFNNCYFHVVGGQTNYVIDLTPGGTRSTLVLNNCFWDGAYGPVVVNNVATPDLPSITVIGGNFAPSNFATLENVTFTSEPLIGDGSSITNLNFAMDTNQVNTGILPANKVTMTNLTRNITIAGFSDLDPSRWSTAILLATNSTSIPRFISLPPGVVTQDGARVYGVGARQARIFQFGIWCKSFTNAVTAPAY
jgi:hypothetical protein